MRAPCVLWPRRYAIHAKLLPLIYLVCVPPPMPPARHCDPDLHLPVPFWRLVGAAQTQTPGPIHAGSTLSAQRASQTVANEDVAM